MRSVAFMLMIITIGSKVVGFLREIALGYFYGTSFLKDIYVIANTIPTVVFGFITTGIITSFIPIYNQIKEEEGIKRANTFTNNLHGILIILSTVFIILGYIFTDKLVLMFAGGFKANADTMVYAVEFTRIMMLSLYAIGFSAVFRGYLNINNDFVTPATPAFVMNAIIITCTVLSAKINVYLLPVGALLGNVLQYVFFFPALKKVGFRFALNIDFKDPYVKQLLTISIPIIISVAAGDIAMIIDKNLASSIVVGGLSSLDYANRLLALVNGVVIVSVTTSSYPIMSRFGAEDNLPMVKKTMTQSMTTISLLVIPAVFGMMALSTPIIDFVFGRGKFGAESIRMTSEALFYYAPFLIGAGIRDVATRGYYAQKNTLTPVIITLGMTVIDIILNIVLSRYMGINGLAVATSIASLIGAAVMILAFQRDFGALRLTKTLIDMVKLSAAALIMGLVAFKIYGLIGGISNLLGLIVAISVGAIVYLILVVLLQVDEMKKLINEFYWKMKKRAKR